MKYGVSERIIQGKQQEIIQGYPDNSEIGLRFLESNYITLKTPLSNKNCAGEIVPLD